MNALLAEIGVEVEWFILSLTVQTVVSVVFGVGFSFAIYSTAGASF